MTGHVGTPPPKRPSRRLRRAVCALGVLLLLGGALATGVPQTRLAQYALGRALGACVRIDGLALVPVVRISGLRLAGRAEDLVPGRVPVELQGVELDYTLPGRSGPRIPSLHIDRVVIDLEAAGENASNYGFIQRLAAASPESEAPSTLDLDRYLPRSASVGDISFAIDSPKGAFTLRGLSLDLDFSSLNAVSARVHGDEVSGEFQPAGQESAQPFTDGAVDIRAERTSEGARVTVRAKVPDLLDVEGTGNGFILPFLPASLGGQARLERCRLAGGPWVSFLPVSLRFGSLDLSGTEVSGFRARDGPLSFATTVRVDGQSVRYGEPGHELYDGDLRITGTFDGKRGDFEAVLNNGQRLSLIAEGNPDEARIVSTLIDWDRADLHDALPKDWRPLLDELPHLDQVAASGELDWKTPQFAVRLSVDPLFAPGAGRAEKFALALSGGGSTEDRDGDWFHGDFNAGLGDGKALVNLDVDTPTHYAAELSLADVELARWLAPLAQQMPIPIPRGKLNGTARIDAMNRFNAKADLTLAPVNSGDQPISLTVQAENKLSGRPLPLEANGRITLGSGETAGTLDFAGQVAETAPSIQGKGTLARLDLPRLASRLGIDTLPAEIEALMSGTVDAQKAGDGISAKLDLTAGPAQVAGLAIPEEQPLALGGTVTLPPDLSRLRAKNLALRLTDDARLDLDGLDVVFSPFSASGHVAGKIDFDYVGPLLGIPSMVGALTVDAPVRLAKGEAESQFRLDGDGFGYGKWAGPYGTPVSLSGLAKYGIAERRGSVENVSGAWGDGSRFAGSPFTFGISPLTASGPVSLETNLSPLIDLRFLDSADGVATASGTLGYGPGGAETALGYTLTAKSFILKNAVAALAGLSSAGAVYYTDTLNGEVKFAAVDTAAAGGMLHDLSGACTIEKGVAKLKGAEATLYSGKLTFDAEVDLLGAEAGGRLNAHLEGVDLDQFTKEYQPPSVRLTGIASGDVLVTWDKDGLRDLRVDLASNQDFSLNKEIVENLLLTSLTSEIAGLKMLNRRIQKKTIGEAPQRKFDSATVSLTLEGERYEEQRLVGPITLKSETLDFSIDVGVDLRAIADALEIQQQAQLQNVDTISAEPVQWGEPEKPSGAPKE